MGEIKSKNLYKKKDSTSLINEVQPEIPYIDKEELCTETNKAHVSDDEGILVSDQSRDSLGESLEKAKFKSSIAPINDTTAELIQNNENSAKEDIVSDLAFFNERYTQEKSPKDDFKEDTSPVIDITEDVDVNPHVVQAKDTEVEDLLAAVQAKIAEDLPSEDEEQNELSATIGDKEVENVTENEEEVPKQVEVRDITTPAEDKKVGVPSEIKSEKVEDILAEVGLEDEKETPIVVVEAAEEKETRALEDTKVAQGIINEKDSANIVDDKETFVAVEAEQTPVVVEEKESPAEGQGEVTVVEVEQTPAAVESKQTLVVVEQTPAAVEPEQTS